MQVETKYEIGQAVWIVYEKEGEIRIIADKISDVIVNEKGFYYLTQETYTELKEQDVVLYRNMDKLLVKLKEIMEEN